MPDPRLIFLVDDNPVIVRHVQIVLEGVGYRIVTATDSTTAVAQIQTLRPDAVILDIMMPKVDGIEILRRLRACAGCGEMPVVMLTAKNYDYDKKLAMDLGANGFVIKQANWPQQLLDCLARVIDDRMQVRFWGVRGTLPAPGAAHVGYGGNTSCVSLDLPNEQFFIFDAGTGIKALSNHLIGCGRAKRLEAKLFISHPHWDHINALPFFAPLYMQGGDIEILGPMQQAVNMEAIVCEQMNGVYFPIKIREFAARVYFRDLGEEIITFRKTQVATMLLNHPGNCLGYRVRYKDRVFCYITDNELYPADSEFANPRYVDSLIDFCRGADALITDATYTDTEYLTKVHWGHSPIGEVVKLAHAAGVRRLCLHHHDPDQDDAAIAAKLAYCQRQLADWHSTTEALAPSEGDVLAI